MEHSLGGEMAVIVKGYLLSRETPDFMMSSGSKLFSMVFISVYIHLRLIRLFAVLLCHACNCSYSVL